MGDLNHVDWHLTQSGWQRGQAEPPTDRVLTMHCHETVMTVECQEVWSCGSNTQIKPLIQKFGHAPNAKIGAS